MLTLFSTLTGVRALRYFDVSAARLERRCFSAVTCNDASRTPMVRPFGIANLPTSGERCYVGSLFVGITRHCFEVLNRFSVKQASPGERNRRFSFSVHQLLTPAAHNADHVPEYIRKAA
jgi:hypothetical protein